MSIRLAITQTLISRQAAVAIAAVAMVALARLLSPEDFGRFAIALAAYGVASTLADFGLTSYLIRRTSADEAETRSAVGLAFALAAATALLALAAALMLPASVLPPDLRLALVLLAGALFVGPVIMPLETALARQLDFRLLSVIGVLQAALNAGTSIALAYAGLGAAALAGGVLVERVVTAGVLLATRRDPFPLPRLGGWGRFGRFGWRLTATQLLPKLGEGALLASLAGLLGLAALGVFNRADRIVRLFDQAILDGMKPVVLPALSRSLDRGVPAATLYLVKVDRLAVTSWPAFALIGVMADPLTAVLLGPGWAGAASVVQALAFIGVAKPFTKMGLKLFVAIDRTETMLRIHAVHQVLAIAFATAGALVSLEAACLGIALALGLKGIALSRALKAATGYDARDLGGIAARSAAITAFALAGPILLLELRPDLADLPTLFFGGVLAASGWLAAALAFRHPLLGEAVGALRDAVPGAASRADHARLS